MTVSILYLAGNLAPAMCNTFNPQEILECDGFQDSAWTAMTLPERGQYVAGLFTPVAFIWFVVGVWLQQRELELVRKENRILTSVNSEQAQALISAGRTAEKQMILSLFEKANEETRNNLEALYPVVEELKDLSRIYRGGVASDAQNAQELISSRIVRICIILEIFFSNKNWFDDVLTYYENTPPRKRRFVSCATSLAFFVETIVERYEIIRQSAAENEFEGVFDNIFSHAEERILFEECRRWRSHAVDIRDRAEQQ